ncbi:MAG: CoA transferase [Alphaproteobacteria bacterium]
MFETLVDYVMVEHLYGACFEPPIAQMGYERLLNTGRRPYATKDGYLCVLPYTDANWQTLFKVSGRDDLVDDPRFADLATRVKFSQEIYDLLGDFVATRNTAEWEEALEGSNIPTMAVNTKEMLLDNEQLNASGFWHLVEHPTEGNSRLTDPPIRFSKTPSTICTLPPLLGEQSRELLAEAGYSAAEIDELLAAKVTKQA